MKTVNLKEDSPSVAELLAMARKKSVLLVSKDGGTTAHSRDAYQNVAADEPRAT